MIVCDSHHGDGLVDATFMNHRMIKKTAMRTDRRPTPGATRILGRFCRDDGGAIAVMVVLLVPVLVGMMGIAVDVSVWYMIKRNLQNAADAAAVSASFEIVNGNTVGAAIAAKTDAERNGFDEAAGAVLTVNIPPLSGPNSGNATSVEVIIIRPVPRLFSKLFLDADFNVNVRAVANAVATGEQPACFVSLDPNDRDAINFQSAQVQLTGCGIKANSNDARALNVAGNSDVTVNLSSVSVTGGFNQSGNSNLTITDENGNPSTPFVGTPVAPDPFEDLDIPDVGPCDAGPPRTVINGGTATLSPGVFCGGLRIQNADVFFEPGEYFIDGGDLEFLTSANIVGDGVVFFLSGDPSSTIGSLDITGGSQLQTTPPDSGDFEGIMFFQDRDAPSGGGDKNRIRGGAQLQVDGAFYFPAQELEISGNAQIQVTSNECAGFISGKLSLNSTQIQINCNPNSSSAVNVVGGTLVSKLGE